MKLQQDLSPKSADPVLLSVNIREKTEAVDKYVL